MLNMELYIIALFLNALSVSAPFSLLLVCLLNIMGIHFG